MQVSQQFGGQRSQLGLSIGFACWFVVSASADAFQALVARDAGGLGSSETFAGFSEG